MLTINKVRGELKMGECTARREGNNVIDVCKHCNKEYTVRSDDDAIWQPSTQIPLGKCSYDDIPLCHHCRGDLVSLIKNFI